MISKVTKGSGTYSLLRYLFTEGQKGENGLTSDHDRARLIGAWDDISKLEPACVAGPAGRNLRDVQTLSRLLDAPVLFAGLETDHHPTVWHLSLTNKVEDKILSDEQWNAVVLKALERTGIAKPDDPDSCRWVAVRHAENHVHVVATLARPSGRRAWLRGDYRTVREVCRQAELEHGLTRTAAADCTAAVNPKRAEQEKAKRFGWEQPARVWLRQQVREAAGSSVCIDDFFEQLTKNGVMVKQRESTHNPGEITGCAFASPNHLGRDEQPIYFSGGKLSPDLTLPKLLARWSGGQPSPRGSSVSKPAASSAGKQQKVTLQRKETWSKIHQEMGLLAEKLSKNAANTDAALAWTAADMSAVVSRLMEGSRTTGPYHQLSALIERAALPAGKQVPAPTAAGRNLRAVSVLLAGLQVTRRGETLQILALLAQLELLVEGVAKMREANNQAHQAQAAREAVEALRAQITDLAPQASTVAGQQWWQAYESGHEHDLPSEQQKTTRTSR